MAGHSKWANIRRHKEKQDAKKGKAYTKLIRAVTVAARASGNPDDNPSLRQAIDKALAANMSNDIIDRAIKRSNSNDPALAGVTEVRYEAYGPHGVALIIDCLTNNRNRTVGEIRHILSKHGGKLGTDGSVAYLFKQVGLISLSANDDAALEQIMDIASNVNADDVIIHNHGSLDLLLPIDMLATTRQALIAADLPPEYSDITWHAATTVPITNPDWQAQIMGLIERLEDLDDVQEVYSNASISE